MFRVATFNIRYDNPADGRHGWAYRREAARACIRQLDCDVLGLQEVLPQQRDYLQQRLPGVQWFGVGRADGRQRGEQSPLVIRRGLFRDIEWHTMWLSSTPGVAGSTGIDTRVPRVATVVRGSWTGRDIGVINTHFDHRGTASRLAAAKQLAGLVATSDRAWVLCGDLNVEPTDEALEVLRGAGLRSVLEGGTHGTFHGFSGDVTGRHIDHIFVDQSWAVDAAWVDTATPRGVIPSDHWPVVADLRLADPPSVEGGAS